MYEHVGPFPEVAFALPVSGMGKSVFTVPPVKTKLGDLIMAEGRKHNCICTGDTTVRTHARISKRTPGVPLALEKKTWKRDSEQELESTIVLLGETGPLGAVPAHVFLPLSKAPKQLSHFPVTGLPW